jgi:ribulose-phosphate 3-epimerase
MSVAIIPAVLPKNFNALKEQLERVRGSTKLVQIDVVDGRFAHNRTWPYKDGSAFATIVKEEHGLPFWDEFDFEFDLMIEDPFERVMDFMHAGASRIIVHAKAPGAVEALQKLADLRLNDDGAFTMKTGVALMPDMQPEVLEHFDAYIDFVQVMGIARVGFQGEPFEKRALYLLERLRRRYPALELQVDGAVDLDNAHALVEAGATRLIVGHAIFEADDPKAEIEKLTAEANRT